MGKANPFGGDNNNPQEESYFNDPGSASRFFQHCDYEDIDRILYIPKPSKKEKNA